MKWPKSTQILWLLSKNELILGPITLWNKGRQIQAGAPPPRGGTSTGFSQSINLWAVNLFRFLLTKPPYAPYAYDIPYFWDLIFLVWENHTCVGIATYSQNFHVCGKNQTCVRITNDNLKYHVCGFSHTCVVFTKYLRHVEVFGKNHTCVGKSKHVCVFPNTGWCILYLHMYLTNILQIPNLSYISFISGVPSQYHSMGTRLKRALYLTCVGKTTHIKQWNNNNNIKIAT